MRRELRRRAGRRSLGSCLVATIYHIAEPDRWDPGADSYEADTLASEGFIHCSTAEQVRGVAEAVFAGRSDLFLLSIDTGAVADVLVYEDLYDHGDDFPHVYGPIPMRAVTSVEPFSA